MACNSWMTSARYSSALGKSQRSAAGAPASTTRAEPVPPPPWVIGWFGVIKCRRSLEILTRVADAMGDRVRIVVRGILSENDVPAALMAETCRRHPNMEFAGRYANPADLARIYGEVHLVWAADFLDAGGNTDWCLPNRLYEGCLHDVVAIASRGTATGRMIETLGLGWTLAEPLEETAPAFVRALEPAAYAEVRARIRRLPRAHFVDETDTRDLVEVLRRLAGGGGQTAGTGRRPADLETGRAS